MCQTSSCISEIISFLVLSLALMFNSCGIMLLRKLTGSEIVQSIIIINLSLAEILIALGWVAELMATHFGLSYGDRAMLVIWALRAGVYCFWFFDMYILAIDRFLGCNFPLKHLIFANSRNVKLLITIVWFICLLNSIILIFLDTRKCHEVYNKWVWILLDGVVVVIYAVTYASIFFSTLKSQTPTRPRAESINSQQSANKSKSQFIKVVGLIVLTFLIFEVCPTTIDVILTHKNKSVPSLLANFYKSFYQLALLFDPLIYIFLQSRVRRLLARKIRGIGDLFKCKQTKITVYAGKGVQKETKL